MFYMLWHATDKFICNFECFQAFINNSITYLAMPCDIFHMLTRMSTVWSIGNYFLEATALFRTREIMYCHIDFRTLKLVSNNDNSFIMRHMNATLLAERTCAMQIHRCWNLNVRVVHCTTNGYSIQWGSFWNCNFFHTQHIFFSTSNVLSTRRSFHSNRELFMFSRHMNYNLKFQSDNLQSVSAGMNSNNISVNFTAKLSKML